jgi:SLT domain-containing protein
LKQIEAAKNQALLASGQQLFDGLASATAQFAGEQSGAYAAMFAVSKAFAVAQAGLQLSAALTQVLGDPTALTPAQKFANVAAVAAAGGALVSAVGSASYSGRALGGPVQANQMYRVNETGAPEIFNAANGRQYMMPNQRGDVVSNKNATDGGSGEPTVIVNIQNNADGSTATASSRREDSQTIIDVVVSNMMSNGKIAQATNRITGTKRAGG